MSLVQVCPVHEETPVALAHVVSAVRLVLQELPAQLASPVVLVRLGRPDGLERPVLAANREKLEHEEQLELGVSKEPAEAMESQVMIHYYDLLAII